MTKKTLLCTSYDKRFSRVLKKTHENFFVCPQEVVLPLLNLNHSDGSGSGRATEEGYCNEQEV